MKLRRGIAWWVLAALYIAVSFSFVHEYFSPLPIRLDGLIVVKR